MRSGRRSPSPPDAITYYLDESLGTRTIASRLRATGYTIVTHDERFAPGTPDIEWIAGLAGSGVVILTKDGRIRRRPLERLALRASGLHAFFLGNRRLRGVAMAEAFVLALPRIERLVRASEAAVWGSIHADGRVTPLRLS